MKKKYLFYNLQLLDIKNNFIILNENILAKNKFSLLLILPIKIALLAGFYLLPLFSHAQNKALTCADLKNGVFHCYPVTINKHYLIRKDGEYQLETDLADGDSTLWKVNWVNDCTYTLKYISGGKMEEDVLKVLKKHKLAYKITRVTSEYYTYTGYIDNTDNNPIQADTMWLTEKVNIINNALFSQIDNEGVLKKNHFSDTSKYAVLYVYRPGKITNSLGNYLLYFSDNLLCVAKNKSGYIFKILKEGKYNISSRLYKDEAAVQLDVKFGKTYYVKSMINWAITSRLYNFKLEMALVKPETGSDEFDKVNLQ